VAGRHVSSRILRRGVVHATLKSGSRGASAGAGEWNDMSIESWNESLYAELRKKGAVAEGESSGPCQHVNAEGVVRKILNALAETDEIDPQRGAAEMLKFASPQFSDKYGKIAAYTGQWNGLDAYTLSKMIEANSTLHHLLENRGFRIEHLEDGAITAIVLTKEGHAMSVDFSLTNIESVWLVDSLEAKIANDDTAREAELANEEHMQSKAIQQLDFRQDLRDPDAPPFVTVDLLIRALTHADFPRPNYGFTFMLQLMSDNYKRQTDRLIKMGGMPGLNPETLKNFVSGHAKLHHLLDLMDYGFQSEPYQIPDGRIVQKVMLASPYGQVLISSVTLVKSVRSGYLIDDINVEHDSFAY